MTSPPRTRALFVLNCPLCGQRLAPHEARNTPVYACTSHGAWFAVAEDGRLNDVQKTNALACIPLLVDRPRTDGP